MATPNIELIVALRTTAKNLRNNAPYAWGHQGTCNCGNLVKAITNFTENEIISFAKTQQSEWTEMAQAHCSSSMAPIDLVFNQLEKIGLNSNDIHAIEYLNDTRVLAKLKGGFRWLQRNQRNDVIDYFEAFALYLEEQLINHVDLPSDVMQSNYKPNLL